MMATLNLLSAFLSRRVSLVEQELRTVPEHTSFPSQELSGVL